MSNGNGQDKGLQRLEVRRRLARLPSKEKLDALIDAPNSRELVRSMPAEDLYYAIVDVGLVDATDIVQLASPTQFRTFVDLAAWQRDRIDPHAVLTWLRAARGDEPEDFIAKLTRLDLEVLEMMLRRFTIVHDLEENPDVNPPGVTMESPEGKYLIEFTVDGVELAALRQLLNDLYGQNAFETARLLEAIRWEVPTEMEEAAYRFRSARLEDLGFPPFEEAVALYSWVDPDSVPKPALASGAAPGLLKTGGRGDYVEAAMRALSDVEQEGFQIELRNVINKALVAEAADPGDLEAIHRIGEMVRDYLNLGLEHLCGGDPALAVDAVRDVPTAQVFKVGFSTTLRLKFRVDRLAKAPLTRIGEVWLTLPEEALALTALRRKRPLRTVKVEGAEPVPFRSRGELDEAGQLIDRAEAQIALFRALLGGDESSARNRLQAFAEPLEIMGTLKLLVGAVAHAVLDGEAKAAPVPAGRLREVCERLFEAIDGEAALRSSAVERAHEVLGAQVSESQRPAVISAVDLALERLRDEVGPMWLGGGTLDPSVGEIVPTVPDRAP